MVTSSCADWLARGLLLALPWVVACSTPTPFACSSDEQCRLDGEFGVCTERSHCAYADAACGSGLRYPDTVDGGLGGQCADSDGFETALGSASSTTEGTTDDTNPFGSTGPGTGPLTVTEPGTFTTEPDPPGSDADSETDPTDDPMACPDPTPNDDPFAAPQLPLIDCAEQVVGEFDEDFRVDWFRFLIGEQCGFSPFGATVTASIDEPAEVCVFLQCPRSENVFCTDESPPVDDDGLTGCCSSFVQAAGAVALECGGQVEAFIRVTPQDIGQACEPYVVEVLAQ